MPDDYNHNLPRAAYRAALLAEVNIPNLPKDRKAAIVAELEALGSRTADEDRAGFESAALGPETVGRAPAAAPVQEPFQGRHVDDTDSGR